MQLVTFFKIYTKAKTVHKLNVGNQNENKKNRGPVRK